MKKIIKIKSNNLKIRNKPRVRVRKKNSILFDLIKEVGLKIEFIINKVMKKIKQTLKLRFNNNV